MYKYLQYDIVRENYGRMVCIKSGSDHYEASCFWDRLFKADLVLRQKVIHSELMQIADKKGNELVSLLESICISTGWELKYTRPSLINPDVEE